MDIDVSRSRLAWWALGAVLVAALLFVAYSFVGTLVFGLFFYYSTRPIYRRIRRKVHRRSVAAAISLLVLALPGVLLMVYALAIGLQELGRFATRVDLGPYESAIDPYLDVSQIVQNPEAIIADPSLLDPLRDSVSAAFDYLGFVGTGLLHLFVMLAIAFYLLRDGPRLARWTVARFGDDRGVLDAYLRAVDRDMNRIFFGNILNAIATGTLGAIAYSVLDFFALNGLHIPYPALVGLLAGVASLIPVIGMKIVYLPVTAYLFAVAVSFDAGYWFVGAFFLVSFVVVDTIPDLVLRPYVSGRGLHVGLVMFAYIFGPLLFGWYGIFLGPMLLVLVVHFGTLVLPELVEGQAIQPYAVDPGYLVEGPEPPAPGEETPTADTGPPSNADVDAEDGPA
ncbi:MAG: AI-2E family transporter [Haloarculaceae archaeon]